MKSCYELDPILFTKKSVLESLEMPVVVRVKEFKEDSVKDFAENMSKAHQTSQPVIPIVIDSYGGSVYGLLSMISILENASKPVATIVEGKAMSAGAILFAIGTPGYRFLSPHATLMLHDVSSWSIGKVEEMKADTKEADRLNKKIFRMISKACGHKNQDYFLDLIHKKGHAEWYMTPNESKKHKLVDVIGLPEYILKVDVNYIFQCNGKTILESLERN